MDIQGLQKLTLLDWPGRVACTIFLGGCDFRCPFCHNRDLVTGPLPAAMDSGELLAFLAKRKGLLDGVCVTGGEPLLRPGLEALLEEIKALGFPIKLDTNGSHPQLLARLRSLGLVDYAAMDIKNSPERYGETAGVPGLDLGPIRESVSWLLEGHVDYEFRTTVVRQFHDSASFRAIGPWISGARRYFLQAFIDRDHAPARSERLVPGGDGGVRRSGPPLGPGSGAAGHLNPPSAFLANFYGRALPSHGARECSFSKKSPVFAPFLPKTCAGASCFFASGKQNIVFPPEFCTRY